MRNRMSSWIGMAAAAVLLVAAVAVAGDKPPDATVRLSQGSVAAGVGWSWASGELMYQGKTYHFKAEGLSVAEVEVTKAEATGNVYNLKSLDDFNGNYVALAAGLTVAGGANVSGMKNQNGVQINLVSTTQGVKFALGAGGVDMKLK